MTLWGTLNSFCNFWKALKISLKMSSPFLLMISLVSYLTSTWGHWIRWFIKLGWDNSNMQMTSRLIILPRSIEWWYGCPIAVLEAILVWIVQWDEKDYNSILGKWSGCYLKLPGTRFFSSQILHGVVPPQTYLCAIWVHLS